MGVKLDEQEAWARIAAAHTGILTTLRRDGWPVALPVWFAVADGAPAAAAGGGALSARRIYVRTPARAAKVVRVRADPRCGFLVESGQAWRELAAVSLQMHATVLADGPEAEAAAAAIDARYAAFREPDRALPAASRAHYSERVVLALDPTGPMVSWDNARLRLRAATPTGAR